MYESLDVKRIHLNTYIYAWLLHYSSLRQHANTIAFYTSKCFCEYLDIFLIFGSSGKLVIYNVKCVFMCNEVMH